MCEYTGKEYRTKDAIRLENKDYLMRLGPQVYVVGESLARFINDCRSKQHYNAEFKKEPENKRALVVATRDISAGEEVFCSYGKWYWFGAGFKPTPYVPRTLSD